MIKTGIEKTISISDGKIIDVARPVWAGFSGIFTSDFLFSAALFVCEKVIPILVIGAIVFYTVKQICQYYQTDKSGAIPILEKLLTNINNSAMSADIGVMQSEIPSLLTTVCTKLKELKNVKNNTNNTLFTYFEEYNTKQETAFNSIKNHSVETTKQNYINLNTSQKNLKEGQNLEKEYFENVGKLIEKIEESLKLLNPWNLKIN